MLKKRWSDFSLENFEKMYKIIPEKLEIKNSSDFSPGSVAGCDVSYRNKAIVSCVVWNIPQKRVSKEITITREIPAEYIPGRFAIRELPLIADAISQISIPVDCLIVDGHGIAHPEKAGIACFVGFLFDLPTIGCAKNILVGEYREIVNKRRKWADIIYKGEKVGETICTKDNTKPIFVSPGYKIGFKSSRELVLNLAINSKYPEPLRLADINTRLR